MILKYGKNNSKQAVRALQYLLDVSVTGSFNSKTKTAVKTFQKNFGLEVDGIAGPETLTALVKTLPDVLYGDYSKSKYVKAVQSLVSTSIDGKYGMNTRDNVKAFQVASRITRTGNVMQNDWLALWDCDYEITDTSLNGTNKSTPEDFKQYDSRWKKKMYSAKKDKSQTIGSSGCGPTSMTDIMATWIDRGLTPVEMCQYALDHGFRTSNSGTAWGYYKSVAKHWEYGFGGFTQTKSMATLKKALAAGAFVVSSMGPGYWTKGGHFICVYKMDDTYVYARDPASSTRKKQKIKNFENQRKQFFIFYPLPKVG